MALHLWRPKHRFPNNPSLIHLFSTSPPDENDNQNPTPNTNRTTFNYFPDIKSGLKTQSTSTPPNSEILKNLAQFRQRTVPPPPTGESTSSFSPSQSSNFSFQESFNRNRNNGVQNRVTHSIDSIRQIAESLKMKSMNVNRGNTTSGGIANSSNSSVGGFNIGLSGFSGSRTVGGTQELPITIFGKEMQANSGEAKLTLLRTYTFDKLGEKLSQLRPEGAKNGEGFSLQELNERLQKLMELDNNKSQSAIRGVLQGVSAGLQNVQDNQNKKKRNGLFACPLMML